jgi:hypothetical protein
MVSCGNQAQQSATAPTASAPPAESAAPVASASVAPPSSATASASATPTPPPVPTKSLQEILANAKTIKLTFRPKLDSNESKSLDITSPATIKAIVDAIGGAQHPEGGGPGYMPTFDLRFVDKDGNPLATVSLFASETMSDSNKKYGRINVSDGTYGGIVVANYADLQKKLKSLGVELP